MASFPGSIPSIPNINVNSMRQATQHTADRLIHWGETVAIATSVKSLLTRMSTAETKLARYYLHPSALAGSVVTLPAASLPFLHVKTATIVGGSAVAGTHISRVIEAKYTINSSSVAFWTFAIPDDYPGVRYQLYVEGWS